MERRSMIPSELMISAIPTKHVDSIDMNDSAAKLLNRSIADYVDQESQRDTLILTNIDQ